jgi:hypothetical protein
MPDMKRGWVWKPAPRPLRAFISLIRRVVSGCVSAFDPLLEPVEHLRLNPANPATRAIPEAHALWEPAGVFQALDMLRRVQNYLLELAL